MDRGEVAGQVGDISPPDRQGSCEELKEDFVELSMNESNKSFRNGWMVARLLSETGVHFFLRVNQEPHIVHDTVFL